MAHLQGVDLPSTARLAGEPVPAEGFHLDPGQVLLVGRSRIEARARIERDPNTGPTGITALLNAVGQGVRGALDGMLELSDGRAEAPRVGAALFYSAGPVPRLQARSFATDPGSVWLQPFGAHATMVRNAPELMPALTTLWLNTSSRDARAARLTVVDAANFAEEERERIHLFEIRSKAAQAQAPLRPGGTFILSQHFNPLNLGQTRALLLRACQFLQFPAFTRSPKVHKLTVVKAPSPDGGNSVPARDIDRRNSLANDRLRTVTKNVCFAVNDSDDSRQGFMGADVTTVLQFGLLSFQKLATAFDDKEEYFCSHGPHDVAWRDAFLAAGDCALLLERVTAETERLGLA